MRRTILLMICVAMLMTSTVFFSGTSVSAKSRAPLPTNVAIGYWHNFDNRSTTTRLGDVNPGWDVLNVSFMVTGGDRCTAQFEPDPAIYSGTLEARKTAFKADIKKLQDAGKHVVISLGGETGTVSLQNDSQRDTFYNSSIDILTEYGFDGFDVDLEGSSVTIGAGDTMTNLSSPIQVNLNYLLHKYVATLGDDFIITMAPEHPYVQGGVVAMGSPWGAYLPFLNQCRDILTFIHPQYYNNAISYEEERTGLPSFSGYNANSYVQLSKMLINGFNTSAGRFDGLRPDQVAFGVPAGPSAANNGVADISEYTTALRTLLQEYPTFRGIMTWSTNWDERNSNRFITAIRATIEEYGDVSFNIADIKSSADTEVDVGSTVTWTTTVRNPTGNVLYRYDLYKDGAVLVSGSYGPSAEYNCQIQQAGVYYVKVSARDDSGAPVTRDSAKITAKIGDVNILSVTADSSGRVPAGTRINYAVEAVGGLAPLTYSFEVYRNGVKVSEEDYGASNTFSYTPVSEGSYVVTAFVKDSAGSVKFSVSPIVVAVLPLEVAEISLSTSGPVAAGTEVTCTVKSSGGMGDKLYSYYFIKDGQVFKPLAYSASNTITFTPAENGNYQIRVYVRDGELTNSRGISSLSVVG